MAASIQLATTQLAEWLKKDYGMSDSEVAIFLGAVLKYDIAELVTRIPQGYKVEEVATGTAVGREAW